ncbi:hypothetical protein FGM00_10245 [Aggregatimonas sangjinii]|uniref:Lipocalin-like domain-containing protein n=1 Tax=Aggregatimonas sangjinii TaxID=2583587 RepID=A0A5B7SV20_9FLAO|nr:hypothetical protein [Aggregatimonas sangjinii]QCX00474.1 hypothetical protein FGM00_10245 [Aggregatimonas sangjinii]
MRLRNALIGLFMVVSISCDRESADIGTTLKSTTLAGTWQLSETYISPGGVTEWIAVENGFQYTFETNGLFKKTENDGGVQEEGSYRLEEDELFLEFEFEGELTTLGFYLEQTDDTITLSPSFPTFCIEACLYRFTRK